MNKLLLVIIIIIAAFFRLYNISETPPGFYPDEAIYANNGVEAWETGDFKVFYPENNGREGLWPNIIGFFIVKFGHEPWVPRVVASIFGILTVVGIYFLARELFRENSKFQAPNSKQIQNSNNQNSKSFGIWNLGFGISRGDTIALLSSFLIATSFWHILFSRIGFRAIMAPFFLTWGLYFLLLSLNKTTFSSNIHEKIKNQKSKIKITNQNSKIIIFSIVAGIFYGLGFYSYIAYRATPLLILIIFVLYWFSILRTSDVPNINGSNFRTSDVQKLNFTRKTILLSTFCFLLSAIIVAAPLGLYFLNNPQDFFGRTTQVSVFNSPTPIKDLTTNILKTAGMFNFIGDGNWRHNYAGRPELFWPVGILFLIGIFIGLKSILRESDLPNIDNVNFRRSDFQKFPFWILFTWFIAAALPVVVSNEGLPHALRAILMAPAVFILAGFGGIWLIEKIKNHPAYSGTKIKNTANENLRFPTGQANQKSKILNFIINTLLFIILSLLIFEAHNTYFIKWAGNPNTAGAFNQNYVALGRELNSLPKEMPKYIVVEASGVDVRGIPMPAQTVMFITDTFTPEKQEERNLFYVLPKDANKIPKNSYIVLLK
jgi:hypothetical protein